MPQLQPQLALPGVVGYADCRLSFGRYGSVRLGQPVARDRRGLLTDIDGCLSPISWDGMDSWMGLDSMGAKEDRRDPGGEVDGVESCR